MKRGLPGHWPEYLMEAAGLGLFMVSAGVFGTLIEFPASPLYAALPDPAVRRAAMGVAMGLTAMGIVYSPWGRRSGAHINPAITVTFLRLGKIAPADAAWYITAQFAGGVVAVLLVAAVLGANFEAPPVQHVATLPGPAGVAAAFVAECGISFVLMLTILSATNSTRAAPFTGVLAGCLVATYIAVESPVSGMSMNPARTLASALPGHHWTALWIYFAAPLLGMLLAAETYVRMRGAHRVRCAKLHHDHGGRCIFRCGYAEQPERPAAPTHHLEETV